MPTLIGSLTRAATRREKEPLNILTFPTHEAYQTCLAQTGHNFFLIQGPGIKTWNKKFRPVPPNHHLLDAAKGNRQVPAELDFDLVLSQNKQGQYPVALQLARQLHLPLVSLEHCLPDERWGPSMVKNLAALRGNFMVFISEYSRQKWGFSPEEAHVIHHGIDTEMFAPPAAGEDRRPHALSVVNDWKNRNRCCGYKLWEEALEGLSVRVVGDTRGLSEAAPTTLALVKEYQAAQVFVNTSLISPIPTALLEAMACGCAVVSTATCMIPEIIQNGENGILADSPLEIRAAVSLLQKDPARARALGEAARQTILERFSLGGFVDRWNALFSQAAAFVYTGGS